MHLLQRVTRPLATVAALSLMVAACDSSGPNDTPFDAEGTNADVAAFQTIFQAPVFEGYSAIVSQMAGVAGGGFGVVLPASVFRTQANTLLAVRRMAANLAGAQGRPNFDIQVQTGTTFEYDLEAGHYLATDRTGAPTNGFRFILYVMNPESEAPAQPLVETGYAQLTITDVGRSRTARVTVVSEGTTYLDYEVTGAELQFEVPGAEPKIASMFWIKGFITDGTERAKFEVSVSIPEDQNGAVSIGYVLELPRRDFRMASTTAFQLAVSTATLTFEAIGKNGRVTMDGSVVQGNGTTTVKVNGELYATITQDNFDPTIVGADGRVLTEEEITALLQAFLIADSGFDIFGQLVHPTGMGVL